MTVFAAPEEGEHREATSGLLYSFDQTHASSGVVMCVCLKKALSLKLTLWLNCLHVVRGLQWVAMTDSMVCGSLVLLSHGQA